MSTKFDGKRGQHGMGGWWVDLDEAQKDALGNKWWLSQIDGRSVPLPLNDKPIWKYENGDMYLGEWKKKGATINRLLPLEEGFGINYNQFPRKCKGLVYIGQWKGGTCHGKGRSLWVESSATWKKNLYPASPIKQMIDGKQQSVPFKYFGTYVNGWKESPDGEVTLKDGTVRRGPWKEGEPVGDWWSSSDHDELLVVAQAPNLKHEPTENVQNQRDQTPPPPVQQDSKPPARRFPPRMQRSHAKVPPVSTSCNVAPIVTPTRQQTRQQTRRQQEATAPKMARPPKKQRVLPSIIDLAPVSTDGEMSPLAVSAQVPEGQQDDVRDRRLGQLTHWLATEAIGRSALIEEMRNYANELLSQGFHSIEMIVRYCTDNDIASWAWMLPVHKRAFTAWLHQKSDASS
jgi:hypothetical protein